MSSATQRADKINKLFKVARKHFQPVNPPASRSVIEHLLYSCLLENATFEAADEIFARLLEEYFDWNEIRVTTTAELSEVMKKLPEGAEAANRLRKALHGLFEAHYSFDIDFLRKENLGKAIEQIEKYKGVTPFGVNYVSQSVLGGHSIPVDESMMLLMQVLGVVTEAEAASFKITGLERTIPKNKGIEFFSVVHQLAVALRNNPFGKEVRAIVLEIDKDAGDRFPRRASRKKDEPAPEPAPSRSKSTSAGSPTAKPEPKVAKVDKGEKKPTAAKAVTKPTPKPPEKKKPATAKEKEMPRKVKPGNVKKTVSKSEPRKPINRKPR